MVKRKRDYVGVTTDELGITYERFLSAETPTKESHGKLYGNVMGPFKTRLGALCYVHYGKGNPHTTTVAECEKIAKKYKDDLTGKPDRQHYGI